VHGRRERGRDELAGVELVGFLFCCAAPVPPTETATARRGNNAPDKDGRRVKGEGACIADGRDENS
jgi:hypothetical protein